MLRLLIITLSIFYAIGILQSQPQGVERISVEHGLTSKDINSFTQDHDGFIWVATKRGGLLRYDGHDFIPFEWEGDVDIESILHYYVDSKGYQYISTEKKGVVRISPSGSFQVFTTNEYGEELYLPSVFEDSAQKIWILSYGQGLSYIDPTDEKLKSYVHDPQNSNSLTDDELYEIVQDKKGIFWIATQNGGLSRFDPETQSFTNYRHNPKNINSIPGNEVYGVQLDHKGRLWISIYDRGIASFDVQTERFKLYSNQSKDPKSLSSNLVWPIKLDGTKGLYIGTQDNGLDYLDFETMEFSNFNLDPNDESSLSGNRVISLFIDQESNLWISSDGEGINFYNRSKDIFQKIYHDPFNSKSIKSNDIMFVGEDEYGHLWLSYNEVGVERINQVTGETTHFSTSGKSSYALSDDNVLSMVCDQNGSVWIGTKFGGINRIDTKSLQVKQFLPSTTNDKDGPLNNWIFYMHKDRADNLWFSSRGALSKYNIDEDQFQHYSLDGNSDNATTPSGSIVQSITEDHKGNIWIRSEEGFEILDTSTQTFRLTDYNFFPWYYHDDDIWYSTLGVLSKFNLVTEETIHYNIGESVAINAVTKGPQGNLWMSCNDGIRKYDLQTGEIQLINKEDGLISNQFVGGSYCSSLTGQLYFNSRKGINTFHPESLEIDTFQPNVKIVSLTYFDAKSSKTEPTVYKEIEDVLSITLPHHYNIINVGFIALSYKKPKKNLYQYRIKELGDRWISLGSDRNITFTNLSPQAYNLEIKGSNGDGIWNETPATLKIIISPPWYATWWAYISYFLITLFIIWQYIRWREREQKRKLAEEKRVVERLKEVDRLKDVFLANTSHELRTPLNGIIGISESMRDGIAGNMSDSAVTNLNMIINSGKRLSHLVNDILDFSKLKNHDLALSITAVDLQSAVDLVIALSQPTIGSKNLKIVNQIESSLALVEADENRLQQILHNLLGNAIKFTHEGSIEIAAYQEDGMIWTTISDTGIGIPEDKMESIFRSFDQVDSSIERKYGGTGLGLSISKQLIEQHGGVINVSSIYGKGTEVSFSLKMSSVTRDDRAFIKGKTESLVPIVDNRKSTKKQEEAVALQETNEYEILVVDDEPVNRQVLANFLKLEGYTAHLADDGYAALEILSENEINLVLLDVMMPGMSGYEVARKIRQSYLPSILPIIMLTSKNGIDDLVTGFNAGANDYLAKPFVRKELISRMQNHLNLQKIIKMSAQFIPDAFIRSLGRESITDVLLGDFAEKSVTVLFTDIRNYTGLSEKMTPKDNFEFVRSYVSKMGPIIQKNQGFVNQYLGDGIMCIFDKGIETALQATIEMQQAIADYNLHRITRKRSTIEVGMGLCAGPLVMGIIGDDMRKDSTVISSSVNMASRIEGLTKVIGAKILFNKNSETDSIDYNKWYVRSLGFVKVRGQEGAIELLECYATDDPDQRDAKLNSIEAFNEAIANLAKGDKDQCLSKLRMIIKNQPQDRVVQNLISHISQDLIFKNPNNRELLLDFNSK